MKLHYNPSTDSKSNSNWDAIVIGAGLGGLSAAAYLAASGKRTLLLERYSVLGGSSHIFRRQKKWEFDCGVHYIGDCGPKGPVPTLLRGLGLDDRIEWLPFDTQAFDTIIGPDLELQVPWGWEQYLENLIRAFPREERGLRFYVAVMKRIADSIKRADSTTGASAFAGLAARAGWAAPWLLVPHAALLAACRFSPKTILALSVQDGAIASTPLAVPVMMRAVFLHDYVGGGAWYPKGGGQILAAGFGEVIQSHDGEIRTQVHVDRIVIEGGRAIGVRLADGEVIKAPAIIAAGDIKRTYRELVGFENLPRSVARRSDNWKMSHPLINGFFGVELDLSKTPNSNYYVIPNWDAASSVLGLQRTVGRLVTSARGRDPLEWANDFAKNQPAFIQCSTRHDPYNKRSAPPGHSAIEAQTIVPADPRLWGFEGYDVAKGTYRRDARYQAIKEIISEGLLARIEQAYPGAAAKVRWNELGSPASQERFTHTSNGAAFGIEARVSQFGPFRPGTRTVIKGLFLAGASTAWGPGTEGAMLSGMHAASAVLGRDLQAEVSAGLVIADRSRLNTWPTDFDPYKATRMLGGKSTMNLNDDEEVNAAPLINRC